MDPHSSLDDDGLRTKRRGPSATSLLILRAILAIVLLGLICGSVWGLRVFQTDARDRACETCLADGVPQETTIAAVMYAQFHVVVSPGKVDPGSQLFARRIGERVSEWLDDEHNLEASNTCIVAIVNASKWSSGSLTSASTFNYLHMMFFFVAALLFVKGVFALLSWYYSDHDLTHRRLLDRLYDAVADKPFATVARAFLCLLVRRMNQLFSNPKKAYLIVIVLSLFINAVIPVAAVVSVAAIDENEFLHAEASILVGFFECMRQGLCSEKEGFEYVLRRHAEGELTPTTGKMREILSNGDLEGFMASLQEQGPTTVTLTFQGREFDSPKRRLSHSLLAYNTVSSAIREVSAFELGVGVLLIALVGAMIDLCSLLVTQFLLRRAARSRIMSAVLSHLAFDIILAFIALGWAILMGVGVQWLFQADLKEQIDPALQERFLGSSFWDTLAKNPRWWIVVLVAGVSSVVPTMLYIVLMGALALLVALPRAVRTVVATTIFRATTNKRPVLNQLGTAFGVGAGILAAVAAWLMATSG